MAAPLQLRQALDLVAADLSDAKVRWALVGGLAVGARAEPRFTRDLAIAAGDDDEAERVVHAMVLRGYLVRVAIEQVGAGRLATVRLTPSKGPGRAMFVDLLFASSGIECEVVTAATVAQIAPGIRGPVASVGHLIALKVLSESDTRLQDRLDLAALAAVAKERDWAQARAALQLISKRGFHRGKPLLRLLGKFRRGTLGA